jgi:D-glycero-D-manno-heptose 1,7-bisphosphate phosphatase
VTSAGRGAIFLDRDGVLNDPVWRDGAPASPRRATDFRIAAGAADAVRRLRAAGLPVFVVTNQPDLARGTLGAGEHARMLSMLRAAVPVDDVAVCPHDDADGCACRKPKPGMLEELAARHGVALARSVMVGDSKRDLEAGRHAGCRTILLRRDYNRGLEADTVVETLGEAVDEILRNQRGECDVVQ